MNPGLLQQLIALRQIFQPRVAKEHDRVIKEQVRFAYYTSADTALNIIRSKTIWMRDAQCMNDYSEVALGYNRVRESSKAFISALDGCSPGLAEKVLATLEGLSSHLQEVYICCLSEHLTSEDRYGRLSMWRAYSGDAAGAALVMRLPPT